MKTKANIAGITSKNGLGDGDWFDREHYVALAIRIGEKILAKNPGMTFTVHQVVTSHNPIRLEWPEWQLKHYPGPDLSGTVSLRRLTVLPWSNPTEIQVWSDSTEVDGSWGGYVTEYDYSGFEGRIFEVRNGVVVYRRDRDGLVESLVTPEQYADAYQTHHFVVNL